MSGVRLLVGTRKGAFVLTSDGGRKKWAVEGPHFAGWEIYHLKGSPADPDRLYASQSSGWFGQVLQRSSDGGKTWEAAGNQFLYEGTPGTHTWYDGTPHPGSSRGSGTSSLRPKTQTWCTRASRMPLYSRPGMPGRPGPSCPRCATIRPRRPGRPAPEVCASTPS